MKFYTWKITISTVEDIDETVCENIVKYFKLKCRYGYVVREMATKWHLHAVVCFKEPIEKKHFEETIWKKVCRTHSTSKKPVAMKSTVEHSHTWYDKYLKKSEDSQELWNEYDAKEVEKYWPTDDQQESLMVAKEAGQVATIEAKCAYTAKHVLDWEAKEDIPATLHGAITYVKTRMYVDKDMDVIRDYRRVHQLAYSLYAYRTGDIRANAEDEAFVSKMDPQYNAYKGCH